MMSDLSEYEKVEMLAQLQCTIEEAAAWFEVSVSSFKRRLASDPKLKEVWERGPAFGRVSLRRLQLRHAQGYGPHAVAMTIHLSKHWLGETDKTDVNISGNININATRTATDIMLEGIKTNMLSKEETIELSELCDIVDESGVSSLTTPQRIRFFTLVDKGSPPVEEEAAAYQSPRDLLQLPSPEQIQ